MTTRWSDNKVAVNKGWGMSWPGTLVSNRAIHPEYLFEGPYGTIPTRNASRGGGALVKGSTAAKAHMAYLRSLRKTGGRKTRGKKTRGGSYNLAALYGGENPFTSTIDDLGDSLKGTVRTGLENALAKASEAAKERAAYYAEHPEELFALGKKYAPSVISKGKSLLSRFKAWLKRKKEEKRLKKLGRYLGEVPIPAPVAPAEPIVDPSEMAEEENYEDVPPPLPPRNPLPPPAVIPESRGVVNPVTPTDAIRQEMLNNPLFLKYKQKAGGKRICSRNYW